LFEVCECELGVDGVPAESGVCDQRQAFALKVLVGVVSTSRLAGLGVSDRVAK